MEIIALIIFGFCVGTYGTLIGIGGGPLVIPMLLLCYDIPPTEIVATSLCVVFFNVIAGSIAYYKQKRIDIISGTKFGLATIPGALMGTMIPGFFSSGFLRIVFGVLLLLLAGYVLAGIVEAEPLTVNREIKKAVNGQRSTVNGVQSTVHGQHVLVERTIIDAEGKKYTYWFNEKLGLFLSAIIGFVATMLGIGGGVIHVPMLVRVLNFPVHIATATAHYKLVICALFGLILYIHFGYVQFNIAVPIGLGTLAGAHLGAGLSRQFSGPKIFKLLSIALIILALRLLFYG